MALKYFRHPYLEIRRPLLVRGHQAARHPVSVSRFPVSVSGSLESGLRDPESGLRDPGIVFLSAQG